MHNSFWKQLISLVCVTGNIASLDCIMLCFDTSYSVLYHCKLVYLEINYFQKPRAVTKHQSKIYYFIEGDSVVKVRGDPGVLGNPRKLQGVP